MNKFLSGISIVLFLFVSCSKEDPSPKVVDIYDEVSGWFDYLCSPSLGGRFSGSAGIMQSCDYICDVIDAGRDSLSIVDFELKNISLRNIIFRIKGKTDSTLVFGAHYDTYGYTTHAALPGADDNTSGIAVLLCIIKWLKESKVVPECNVEVCFWDGEEIGRLGSDYYVSQLDEECRKRMLYINVDTVGSDKYYQVTLSHDDSHLPVPGPFYSLASSLSIPVERYSPMGFTTDCEPFLKNDIPFINICCDRLPPYHHKPMDVVSNISFKQIVNIANAITENIIFTN